LLWSDQLSPTEAMNEIKLIIKQDEESRRCEVCSVDDDGGHPYRFLLDTF
jgi:hypothetical protein